MNHPAAIILAGGASTRMGRPKATLEIDGETFAARLVRTFSALTPDVVLVTGALGDFSVAGARTIFNPQWRAGQLTSLQAGLRVLTPDTPAVFFTPVDCPLFRADTVEALWRRFQELRPLLAIPRYGDRRGHPVLVSAAIFPEFLALPASGQARDVIHARRPDTVYVDVDDEGIVADIDTPDDYARWVRPGPVRAE